MGLKPKNKGHANFYECCDLTKKVYLEYSALSLELFYKCHILKVRDKNWPKFWNSLFCPWK